MVAQLERDTALLQLLGNRDHRDIAYFEPAVSFRHIEIPKPLFLGLFFERLHDRDITPDFRILALFDPALPTAPFEDIGTISKVRLEWNQLIADKFFDDLAQAFFFWGEAKLHSRTSPFVRKAND
jgi:hypothetical protein